MRIAVLLTLVLLGAVFSSSLTGTDLILQSYVNKPTKELFKVYHFLFAKEYKLDSEEGIRKYKIFKNSLKAIKAKNQELGKEVYGITQFTDMTDEEFQKTILMKEVPEVSANEHMNNNSFYEISEEPNYDYRSIMNTPRNQKSCGSCWSFGAVASIEGNYNKSFNEKIALSEQFLVDCDSKDNGCNGGYPNRTFPWIMNNGVVNADIWTYQAKSTYCTSNLLKQARGLVTDFESCEKCKTLDAWLNILKNGPAVVAMDASDPMFKNFKPKNGEQWVPSKTCGGVNHAVTAVGAVVENGEVVLIVRNSWDVTWGDQGNFKVPAKKSCGIVGNIWRPVVQKEGPLVNKNCPTIFSQCNYKGNSLETFCKSFSDLSKTPLKGKCLSMDKNKFSDTYYGYEKVGCLGKKTILLDDKYPCINSPINSILNPNNRFSCIGLYSEPCYSGDKIEICGEISDMSNAGIKTFGSLFAGEYAMQSMVFYEKPNFQGPGLNIPGKEYPNLSTETELLKVLKNAKSIRVKNKCS